MNETPPTVPVLARTAIERVIWKHGHQGDACAYIAVEILASLRDAGFLIVPREVGGPNPE